MNIAVCIKQVPDTGMLINFTPDKTGIVTGDAECVINPYDEYALEAALLLKDKDRNINVTAVTAGVSRCRQVLASALAVGADRGIFVEVKEDRGYDSFFNANLVGETIQNGFDLVLCGLQGADFNNGLFPVYLAKKLNIPVITNIFSINLAAEFQRAQAVRLNADGSKTVFVVKLPTVLSLTRGENVLRYASLSGIIKARTKEIITFVPAEDAVAALRMPLQIKELYHFEQKRDNIIITDADGAAANRLLDYLSNNLKAFE